MFLCLMLCLGMLMLGLAIGFLVDWLQGRILR